MRTQGYGGPRPGRQTEGGCRARRVRVGVAVFTVVRLQSGVRRPASGIGDPGSGVRAQPGSACGRRQSFGCVRAMPSSSCCISTRKLYCVYVAPDKDIIEEHARCGGFPADRITEVSVVIDPSTGD